MSDALSPVLQWLNTHPELAGLATFTISAAESVAIVGTIVPGSVMMSAIGALAGVGVIPLWNTIIWAILGAIVGDGISYWIGRYFNTRLATVWPFRKHPSLLENGEAFFRKYGSMSVLIGRFVGPVRALVPLVAGMLGMSPLRFTLANVASAIAWAPAYMLPGILLGAASLELPPDVAVHVIIMLLAAIFCSILALWIIYRIFKLIRHQIDHLLTWIWHKLFKTPYFRLMTKLLQHHNSKKNYGQLTLAFYLVITCCVLFYFTLYILTHPSASILLNTILFNFFRSLRTPNGDNIMLAITFLGEKKVLLPLIATLFTWLAYTKRWHTAWHVLLLGVITGGSIEAIKFITHSPRPWGVLHNPSEYSFPSGHTTLTVVFYFGIALLLIKALKIQSRRLIYYTTTLLVLAVSISRLYLGAHWFTDIIGGWLLGAAILMFIVISYNRHGEKPLHARGIILTILLTLACTYSIVVYRDFNQFKQDFTQVDWPTHSTTVTAWWQQKGSYLPLYRTNRFGLSTQILNLQWLDELDTIQRILLQNGWEVAPTDNWIDFLHRVSNVNSTEHIPWVSPLYLGKDPVLVLIKHFTASKNLFILRLWYPNVLFTDSSHKLWVGTVEAVPPTYSWLFKHKQAPLQLSTLIFTHQPKGYVFKTAKSISNKSSHSKTQTILFIRPK